MADVGRLLPDDIAFLEPYLPQAGDPSDPNEVTEERKGDLPFVTLTYASSLDSMVALAAGARTTLSGPETKRMTHFLRLRHDAILIGVGTAVVDDPSLNCRYPGAALIDQPRPVIIDPNRRWSFEGKKAYTLAANGHGKGPWIISCSGTSAYQRIQDVGGDNLVLDNDGAITGEDIPGNVQSADSLPWKEILRKLKQKGIDSVMIEGGARVINSLLSLPDLIDSVIITIAPTWLGRGGVQVQPAARTDNNERVNSAWLQSTTWRQLGNDVIVCGRLSDKKE